MLIRLTPQGIALIDEAIPAITRFENELVSHAISSDQERTVVADGLRRLLVEQENAKEQGNRWSGGGTPEQAISDPQG